MASNKKITELTELTEIDLSDDDVLPIVDVSAGTTNKVRKSTLASALAGVASLSATSPVTVSAGTGAVNIAVTTIPITSGGTGATTAADARTNLGVPAATDVVTGPASATDSALALFDGTTGKLIKDSTYTITAAGAALIDDASASAQRTTLGAAASGANTDITSLGGLTTDIAVADGGTGASTASAARSNLGAAASGANTDITSLGGLTTDIAVADGGTGASDASTARTNLGLGSIATQNSNSVSITGGSITGITDIAVADGGTGASSLTANGVLYGNGTSAFGATAVGTSGQVLTSNGSGSAPTFQDAGGRTYGTPVTLSSVSSVTFSGIPSGTERIEISIWDIDFSTSDTICSQLGDSGGIETSGYANSVSSYAEQDDTGTDRFRHKTSGVTTQGMAGLIQYSRVEGNKWTYQAIIYGNRNDYSAGRKELSGELTQIKLFGTFGYNMTGYAQISYE